MQQRLLMRRLGLSMVGAAALASACGEGLPYSGEEVGQQTLAVAGGTVDEEEQWPGVVYLRTPMPGSVQLCSGTLVAPNLVVTALHCVAPLGAGDIQCTYKGELMASRAGAGQLGNPVAPEIVEVRMGVQAPASEPAARGVKIYTTNSSDICSNDLALVELDHAFDVPLRPLRLDKVTVRGEPLTIVGYGDTGEREMVLRRHRSDVRVLAIGNDTNEGPRASAPPRTFAVEPSACQGDSGGPALAQAPDFPLAGVNSLVLNECGGEGANGVYTRLAPFKNLILNAFAASGNEVWLEGQPAPGTAPIDAGPDDTESSNSDSDDTSEETNTPRGPTPGSSNGRRLTSGCSVVALPSIVGRNSHLALLLGLAFAGVWRRRRC